jgi:hypothetical protein
MTAKVSRRSDIGLAEARHYIATTCIRTDSRNCAASGSTMLNKILQNEPNKVFIFSNRVQWYRRAGRDDNAPQGAN